MNADTAIPSQSLMHERESTPEAEHLSVLDGWRGLSILCVLACHFLPIGPKSWELNGAAGLLGMSLFFTLSGFLITVSLNRQPEVVPFLVRRFFRILPLAYLYIAVSMLLLGKSPDAWIAHGLFLINYQTQYITDITGHFWSICVEIHFYVGVATLVLIMGKRALLCLPVLCIAVTCFRIWTGTYSSIATHLRVDEILAGASLAMVMSGSLPKKLREFLVCVPLVIWMFLLLISCHRFGGPANYIRPYLAAGLVGNSICRRSIFHVWLESRILKYIAEISYALYVVHPLAAWGWLGTGSSPSKYLIKRPITFLLTFSAAHLTTYYFERLWTKVGKSLARRMQL